MEKADGLIKFKQRYIYADAETLQKLQAAMAQGEKLTPAQILQAALTGEYESAPVHLTDEVRQLMDELTRQEHIPLPAGLNATLRLIRNAASHGCTATAESVLALFWQMTWDWEKPCRPSP